MLLGVPISPTSVIRMAIPTWRWTSMVSAASAFSRKHEFFDLASISRPSVSRNTPKPKASAMAKRMGYSVVGLPHYTI
ncbi:hypothetical protein BN1708_018253, partial [Verticillium longisporum]